MCAKLYKVQQGYPYHEAVALAPRWMEMICSELLQGADLYFSSEGLQRALLLYTWEVPEKLLVAHWDYILYFWQRGCEYEYFSYLSTHLVWWLVGYYTITQFSSMLYTK